MLFALGAVWARGYSSVFCLLSSVFCLLSSVFCLFRFRARMAACCLIACGSHSGNFISNKSLNEINIL
ncbi:hypothetical protein GBN18_11170 [Plesiomonas shigelloides]|nr:hypothetical protein GBN18_11170 [Plesiomonas shigelloides]